MTVLWSPLAWWAFAFAAYGLAANAAWALGPSATRALPPWALPLLRALYLVGVPAAAVALRVGRPSHLGLVVPQRPLVALLVALALGVALAALLAASALALEGGPWWPARLAPPSRDTLAAHALEAVQLEAHWAFARAAALAAGVPRLGEDEANLAAAMALALGLLALEALVAPPRRAALEDPDPERRAIVSRRAALALLSMLVFALTLSSVAALVAHLAARALLAAAAVDVDGGAWHPGASDARPVEARRRASSGLDEIEPTVV